MRNFREGPTVSVVLRSWNALELLKLTLTTLKQNTKDIDYELIIVDDNSDFATVSFLLNEDAILVLNKKKVGPGGVVAQGTRLASGRYVAIIDNDILFSEGWLTGLVEELETHKAHIIAPNRFRDLLHPDSKQPLRKEWERMKAKNEQWYKNPLEVFLAFSTGRDISEFSRAILSVSHPGVRHLTCPPQFIGGSCIVYDREFVESIGGPIDKAFYSYGVDDADLCWRIGNAKGKVLRSGKTHVHHFEHSSVSEGKIDYKESIDRNNQVLFQKWDKVLCAFIQDEMEKGQSLNMLTKHMLISKYLEYPDRTFPKEYK